MDYIRLVKISAMNEKNDIIMLLIGRLDFIDYTNFNYQERYTDGELPKCLGEGRVLSAESYHLNPPTRHEKWITTKQIFPIFRRVKASIYREFHEEKELNQHLSLF